jgi:hypothetical protein
MHRLGLAAVRAVVQLFVRHGVHPQLQLVALHQGTARPTVASHTHVLLRIVHAAVASLPRWMVAHGRICLLTAGGT